MLCELRARQFGVIEDVALVLGPGMTALTGETGAGKTLVVEALQLLCGGRSAPGLVRAGQDEASIEGRFLLAPGVAGEGALDGVGAGQGTGARGAAEAREDGAAQEHEVVLARVVPSEGRSRAYVDNAMASLATLAEMGRQLVDLHGQHAHQSLFSASAQRRALDAYAGVATARRDGAAAEVRRLQGLLAELGGGEALRQREADFLRFQLDEVAAAALQGPDEDDQLAREEELLGEAGAHRAAASGVYELLAGEDQAVDRVGRAVAALAGRGPLCALHGRLASVAAELTDLAGEARRAAEDLEEDPERLAAVVARRARLHELRRKYGGRAGGMGGVLEWQAGALARLAELESAGERAALAEAQLLDAGRELRLAATELGRRRREAGFGFASAVESELRRLAMPRARFEVHFGPGAEAGTDPAPAGGLEPGAARVTVPPAELRATAAEDVTFMFAADAGEPLQPLARTASGGELARAMLAVRLVMLEGRVSGGDGGPGTLVFDEVDAGIGGEAALAVGAALSRLAQRFQVIVVTHLAQVAAFAGSQVAVRKVETGARTVSTATVVVGEDRVTELSRMLSGRPGSAAARSHARELLAQAGPCGDFRPRGHSAKRAAALAD